MINTEKIQWQTRAYLFAMVLVFILAIRFGRELAEWLLVKLYEIFIARPQSEL